MDTTSDNVILAEATVDGDVFYDSAPLSQEDMRLRGRRVIKRQIGTDGVINEQQVEQVE